MGEWIPGDASRLTYRWEIEPADVDLDSFDDTKTGAEQAVLRVRPNKLRPGRAYRLSLIN